MPTALLQQQAGVGGQSAVRTQALSLGSAPPAPLDICRFLLFGFLVSVLQCGSHVCETCKGGCLVQGDVSITSFATIGGILVFS